MLRWRLLLGTLFIAGIVALCWLDHRLQPPGMVLLPLALALSVLATREMLWLSSARNFQPSAALCYVGNLLIVGSNAVPVFWPRAWPTDPLGMLGWPLATFALLVLAAFCVEMRRRNLGAILARIRA